MNSESLFLNNIKKQWNEPNLISSLINLVIAESNGRALPIGLLFNVGNGNENPTKVFLVNESIIVKVWKNPQTIYFIALSIFLLSQEEKKAHFESMNVAEAFLSTAPQIITLNQLKPVCKLSKPGVTHHI
jgi:hypothetical protein